MHARSPVVHSGRRRVQIDLHQATNLAASAHAMWGMGKTLRAHSSANALSDPWIETAVEAILREAHARATALVTESRDAVVRLAGRLQADRYLDAAEVRAVVEGPRLTPERRASMDAPTTGRRGRHPDPMP